MSDPMDRLEGVCSRALMAYGERSQLGMVQEEAGEVVSAINKLERDRLTFQELADECADLFIVNIQLGMIVEKRLGPGAVDAAIARKIKRLEARLDKLEREQELAEGARP